MDIKSLLEKPLYYSTETGSFYLSTGSTGAFEVYQLSGDLNLQIQEIIGDASSFGETEYSAAVVGIANSLTANSKDNSVEGHFVSVRQVKR